MTNPTPPPGSQDSNTAIRTILRDTNISHAEKCRRIGEIVDRSSRERKAALDRQARERAGYTPKDT